MQRKNDLIGIYVGGHEFSTQGPIFSGLQLPLLERIVIRTVIYILSVSFFSSLPLFVPFLSSLPYTRPIRLCLHLRLSTPSGGPWWDLNWSDLAAFLALPIFRHPQAIELCTDKTPGIPPLDEMISSFKRNSYLKGLLATGELVIKESVL